MIHHYLWPRWPGVVALPLTAFVGISQICVVQSQRGIWLIKELKALKENNERANLSGELRSACTHKGYTLATTRLWRRFVNQRTSGGEKSIFYGKKHCASWVCRVRKTPQ